MARDLADQDGFPTTWRPNLRAQGLCRRLIPALCPDVDLTVLIHTWQCPGSELWGARAKATEPETGQAGVGPPSFRPAPHCQCDHISEHRAAPSTPCPRAVPPTSQRDPHLEGQFHLDGERSGCAVRPPGPCTTLGRREGCSRGSLDEDTEDRSGHRAPTGREAVTDNSAQMPTPGFGPRATARCPPARWHG